jgi:hypothetical protein
MSQANNLLEIWDTYSKQVLCEKKTPKVTIGKKEGTGSKDLDDKSNKGFAHKDSGPSAADVLSLLMIQSKQEKPIKMCQNFLQVIKNLTRRLEKQLKQL